MNNLPIDVISIIYNFMSFKESFNISMLNKQFYTAWRLHKFDETLYIKAKNKHLIEKYSNINFGMRISSVGDLVSKSYEDILQDMIMKPINKNSYKNLAETSLKLITKINFFPKMKFVTKLHTVDITMSKIEDLSGINFGNIHTLIYGHAHMLKTLDNIDVGNLKVLHIIEHRISNIDNFDVGGLKEFCFMGYSGCRLRDVSKFDVKGLEVLDLSFTKIEKLCKLKNLRKLCISWTRIKKLFDVENLEELKFNGNSLLETDLGFFDVKNLKYLDLQTQKITSINGFNIKNLNHLNLSRTKINNINYFDVKDLKIFKIDTKEPVYDFDVKNLRAFELCFNCKGEMNLTDFDVKDLKILKIINIKNADLKNFNVKNLETLEIRGKNDENTLEKFNVKKLKHLKLGFYSKVNKLERFNVKNLESIEFLHYTFTDIHKLKLNNIKTLRFCACSIETFLFPVKQVKKLEKLTLGAVRIENIIKCSSNYNEYKKKIECKEVFKIFNGRSYYQAESDFFFKNKKEEYDYYYREVSSSESVSDE